MSVTTQYALPSLPYSYDALEPYISRQIMELHHDKHHQSYVTNLNNALQTRARAVLNGVLTTDLNLQSVIRFNAGGHINHSLFWQNLCPADSPDADMSSAPRLTEAIRKTWGDDDTFRSEFNKSLLGIQGSGWGWLVRIDRGLEKRLEIVTTKDQDPVTGDDMTPLFGVDMWEHAYYLQYLNGKAAYVDNIWNVINWRMAEQRYVGTHDDAFLALKANM